MANIDGSTDNSRIFTEEEWVEVEYPSNSNENDDATGSSRIFVDADSGTPEGCGGDKEIETDTSENPSVFDDAAASTSQGEGEASSSSNEIETDKNTYDGPAIGIDLGTTFSCAAMYKNGRTDIIVNQDGSRLTPSIVFFDPDKGDVFVGKIADSKFPKSPNNTLQDAKRFIGRQFDDEFISRYNKSNNSQFTLIRADDDKAAFEIEISNQKIKKKPEDISAEILKNLKQSAEIYLGTTVTNAVISVPAYFSNAQRKATKKAAELAGLTVLKLITEPTAAAIHYVYDKNRANSNIMVFDLGGGTLDISLINVKNNTFEVKAVYGDTLLGGRNFDELLFEHFYKGFEHMNDDGFATRKFKRRLANACIEMKETLSNTDDFTLTLDVIDGISDLDLHMTRERFEEMGKDIFQQITDLLEIALDESDIDKSEIDEVVLVGGSTRIPKIKELLSSFFGPEKLHTDLNPDEAVAAGAGIHAAVLTGDRKDLEKYKVTEVTPMSLGLAHCGNIMDFLIPKNSSLPATATETYTTVINDQTTMKFEIFEGERKNTKFNNLLGKLYLQDLTKVRAGELKVIANFHLDEDGILSIEAIEETTGKSKKLVITMEQFRLSQKKIRRSIEDARRHKAEDAAFETARLMEVELLTLFNRLAYGLE